ncbi:MAG: ABC transporter substrate-binding protein [Coriobacteriales bacterium]|nr:ABC transporter substrate-binding protein [Coriobacteriales bacterium]
MKTIRLLLVLPLLVLCAGLGGCFTGTGQAIQEITVVSPFDSSDGNRDNFVAAYTAFEEETGVAVVDRSAASNEEWKNKVRDSFGEGSEPDVLFFFTGADADSLIRNGKVVSLSEIRREYPDYASNMRDSLIPVSPVDGRQYAVPVNGYWEALYVNKKVLAACGVEVPGNNYTWEQFSNDCETILSCGYVPIAASLGQVPHYWFEYCVFNHGSISSHTLLPASSNDGVGQAWAAGLEDIKDLYERGYFPAETTTMTDDEAVGLMISNRAAFHLDGSWKLGWYESNAANIDDFTVAFVPAQGSRAATDIVGGLSMGYYISQKAWNNPDKRDACVRFVMAMTTDEVVSSFGLLSMTALKNGTTPSGEIDKLSLAALELTKGCTGTVAAAQDGLSPGARDALFADVPRIVMGQISPEQAIDDSLAIMYIG